MELLTVIRLVLIGTGILFLILDFMAYARQQLTDGIGLIWGFFALLLLLAGIFPKTAANANVHIVLAVAAVGLLMLLLLFKLSMSVSVLAMKNQELAMQVSLLNQENERILHELGMMDDEEETIIRN